MNPNEVSKEVLFDLVVRYKNRIEELETVVRRLSDDELWELFVKHGNNGLNYARAIEEYYGIK
jgi:hypothetical protein